MCVAGLCACSWLISGGGLDSGHFLLGWKVGAGSLSGLDCWTRSGWDVKGSEMGCGTGLTWPVWQGCYCFVLQYNTEVLVLVLQCYFGKLAILRQYQTSLSGQSACTAHAGISDRVTKEIEIMIVSN